MGFNLIMIKEFKRYSFVAFLMLTVEDLISEKECPLGVRSVKGKGTTLSI